MMLAMRIDDLSLASISSAIECTEGYEVAIEGDTVVATRRRFLPARGVSRLLFPRAAARIEVRARAVALSVRPDGWAWLMLVVCAGGLFVEGTMDRARYPREYPPEFIFVVSACVVVALVYDVVVTRSGLTRVLADLPRSGGAASGSV